MATGLVAGYGAFAGMAVRYLYPAKPDPQGWLFVAAASELKKGEAVLWKAPDGSDVGVTRRADGDAVDAFLALSTTCPHLGCKVHWEPQKDRFFCPCHNGAFDPTGRPTEGPPAKANQWLPRYPLKVEEGLLYVRVRQAAT